MLFREMGRPIGSLNREKPFKIALQIALRARPQSLRRIADQLIDRAEQGDLAYIRELVDRLDGKAAQAIDYGEISPRRLTDEQLEAIAAGALTEDLLALPPPPEFSDSK
jgi:hypothetical protein